jgi:hypothetical protein
VPVLLVDGAVAGVWERRRRGGLLEVRVEPFVPATRRLRRPLEHEAARIGAFLETEAALSIGRVDTRPHL